MRAFSGSGTSSPSAARTVLPGCGVHRKFLAKHRYWVHNLKQDGFSYRLNARNQRARYDRAEPEYKSTCSGRKRKSGGGCGRSSASEPRPESRRSIPRAWLSKVLLSAGRFGTPMSASSFQSIGQPILSGREDNTPSTSTTTATTCCCAAQATWVDGKVQNIHYGLVNSPGGKANYCTYRLPDAIKTGAFFAGDRFDFAEGAFHRVYQYGRAAQFYYPFGHVRLGEIARPRPKRRPSTRANRLWTSRIKEYPPGPANASPPKGRDLFIVTDTLKTADRPHALPSITPSAIRNRTK